MRTKILFSLLSLLFLCLLVVCIWLNSAQYFDKIIGVVFSIFIRFNPSTQIFCFNHWKFHGTFGLQIILAQILLPKNYRQKTDYCLFFNSSGFIFQSLEWIPDSSLSIIQSLHASEKYAYDIIKFFFTKLSTVVFYNS